MKHILVMMVLLAASVSLTNSTLGRLRNHIEPIFNHFKKKFSHHEKFLHPFFEKFHVHKHGPFREKDVHYSFGHFDHSIGPYFHGGGFDYGHGFGYGLGFDHGLYDHGLYDHGLHGFEPYTYGHEHHHIFK
ncbi:unnamed protein product [Phyllotreta striolata]|uniref:Uncharacterized protein n=1 Tax=Phyllotreta striolata TaxID=444603 RepID=A0A9N9XNQ7_PHYSR|nr:unnamed protein product [Phyllotreta striolata]